MRCWDLLAAPGGGDLERSTESELLSSVPSEVGWCCKEAELSAVPHRSWSLLPPEFHPFGRGWCGAPLRSQRRCQNPPILGRTALPGAGRWSARYRRSRARWGRIELRTGIFPAGRG